MKKQKLLEIQEDTGSDYAHIRLAILQQDEQGKVRNYRYSSFEQSAHEFYDDLAISCQFHKGSRECYGYQVIYRNPYSVGYDRAELMHKTLKRIESRMQKLNDERGHVADFAEYAGRVAEIIGAKFCLAVGEVSGWHDDNTYEVMSRSVGVSTIRNLQGKVSEKMEAAS